jgi:hypothetical protein
MVPRASGLVLVLIIGGEVGGGARRYLVILTKVRMTGGTLREEEILCSPANAGTQGYIVRRF